ncbi:TspO/MBR-related protein [Schizophyllum commune]
MPLAIPTILLEAVRNPVVAVGLPLTLGWASGFPTAKVVREPWYQNLNAPPGRPPRQVFPIVWPILYASMGYAAHVAAKSLETTITPSGRDALNTGLAIYYGQLVLNFAWSSTFFGAKQIGFALLDSAALLGSVVYMTKLWDGPTRGQTTVLLAPYCLWAAFATYLNGGYYYLNCM